MSQSYSRQGFTLIELLVVISIIAILAGMLLPAISMVRENARNANCGSNQHQIVTAMLTYGNENDGAWPYHRGTDGATTWGNPIVNAGATTDRSSGVSTLEFLSSWSDGELVPKLFACPSNGMVKPGVAAKNMDVGGTVTSTWTIADVGYAYDGSVPANGKANRVVIGDRPISGTDTNHKKLAVVVYCDGHVANVKFKTNGVVSGATTYYSDGSGNGGSVSAVYDNKDAIDGSNDDNVYDLGNDINAMLRAGRGSTTRCFLR